MKEPVRLVIISPHFYKNFGVFNRVVVNTVVGVVVCVFR